MPGIRIAEECTPTWPGFPRLPVRAGRDTAARRPLAHRACGPRASNPGGGKIKRKSTPGEGAVLKQSWLRITKGCGTRRSRVVAHPSTGRAWQGLTAEIGRVQVLSLQYGRIRIASRCRSSRAKTRLVSPRVSLAGMFCLRMSATPRRAWVV
jgi:hypothetical protein